MKYVSFGSSTPTGRNETDGRARHVYAEIPTELLIGSFSFRTQYKHAIYAYRDTIIYITCIIDRAFRRTKIDRLCEQIDETRAL